MNKRRGQVTSVTSDSNYNRNQRKLTHLTIFCCYIQMLFFTSYSVLLHKDLQQNKCMYYRLFFNQIWRPLIRHQGNTIREFGVFKNCLLPALLYYFV